MNVHKTPVLGLVFLAITGCGVPESRSAAGVVASDEPRIWVVRTIIGKNQSISEVYRCADGAPSDQPPRPICVKAPMGE